MNKHPKRDICVDDILKHLSMVEEEINAHENDEQFDILSEYPYLAKETPFSQFLAEQSEEDENHVPISYRTYIKAIKKLEHETHQIYKAHLGTTKTRGQYEYYRISPIKSKKLDMLFHAIDDQTSVTLFEPNQICFLDVPEGLSYVLSDCLCEFFRQNDVRVYPITPNLIMTIDIPPLGKIYKKAPLYDRLNEILINNGINLDDLNQYGKQAGVTREQAEELIFAENEKAFNDMLDRWDREEKGGVKGVTLNFDEE